jgi:hypothetical protein
MAGGLLFPGYHLRYHLLLLHHHPQLPLSLVSRMSDSSHISLKFNHFDLCALVGNFWDSQVLLGCSAALYPAIRSSPLSKAEEYGNTENNSQGTSTDSDSNTDLGACAVCYVPVSRVGARTGR